MIGWALVQVSDIGRPRPTPRAILARRGVRRSNIPQVDAQYEGQRIARITPHRGE